MIKSLTVSERGDVLAPRVTCTRGTRCVLVQGMVHIAPPTFFSEIEADLLARESDGWRILHEGSGGKELRAFLDQEQEGSQETPGSQGMMTAYFRTITAAHHELTKQGLSMQSFIMKGRDSWISADFSPEEFRRLCPELIEQIAELTPDEFVSVGKRMPIHVAQRSSEEDSSMRKDMPSNILIARNKRAVRTILRTVDHASVAIHYGAMHVDGIVAGLVANGFKVANIERVRAIPKELAMS